ncbi:(2,3-dihydroxybenzoyl)adenylate synthase [Celeribacter indicus]|uniref:AMP-dependent synthetase and ligase n=1 Tax=Celeribacter indicus TaxID=1208324 RepID=A0A0B5DUX3_9RHOB|nr:AMP-binding protein [Celeribacter indicus]AJE46824.1 AMP-dependent synthetase and ligase [Celeribacter indicus]SDW81004.1 2,3-dihydroxybenzoate-AMP ligase [Celeribacter indicus]
MRTPTQTWPDDLAQSYRDKGYWKDETFGEWLERLARSFGPRTALVAGDTRLTYDELLAEAQAIAGGLLASGLNTGERVLVQLPNSARFLPVVLGVLYAGLLPVYALPAHREREILHLAQGSQARAYVVAARHEGFDYAPLARQALADCPDLVTAYIDGEAEGLVPLSRLRDAAPLRAPAQVDPASVAFLQISGGTTGFPKLIPRTHNDYIYSFEASAPICGLTQESALLIALPAAHNFPMSSPGYFGALSVGAKVVMSLSPAPDACFPLIGAERITHTGLVPPLALLWMQAAAKTKHDLSSLEVLGVGGAKFTPEAAARVRPTLGCKLQQVFGMGEGLVNYTRLDDPEEIVIGTQGRPISPDDEILLLREDGTPVAEGEPGVLHTRGPYTIRAYYNAPEANRRAFIEGGYYCTGDIVRLRPGGYLEVQGRAGDHINRAGEKVSAEEIEDHLLAHEAVFDAVVVAVEDRFLGERSCAFVVLEDGAEVKPPALKAFIRARGIAAFKVPDQIVFIDALETTAVGKTDRRKLRAQLKEKHFA